MHHVPGLDDDVRLRLPDAAGQRRRVHGAAVDPCLGQAPSRQQLAGDGLGDGRRVRRWAEFRGGEVGRQGARAEQPCAGEHPHRVGPGRRGHADGCGGEVPLEIQDPRAAGCWLGGILGADFPVLLARGHVLCSEGDGCVRRAPVCGEPDRGAEADRHVAHAHACCCGERHLDRLLQLVWHFRHEIYECHAPDGFGQPPNDGDLGLLACGRLAVVPHLAGRGVRGLAHGHACI
mmetsp:Transcript_27520/g.67950  ORF Transcript_27520/g.67950 Transcript_27520/m.67950 type:complete len:233 (+) Transcript_27520:593-1291(+)